MVSAGRRAAATLRWAAGSSESAVLSAARTAGAALRSLSARIEVRKLAKVAGLATVLHVEAAQGKVWVSTLVGVRARACLGELEAKVPRILVEWMTTSTCGS